MMPGGLLMLGFGLIAMLLVLGRPVRLIFTRQEGSTCSEEVLFPDFKKVFVPA
ncbi:MAG: hypothetical protein HY781_13435 [Chloroflexi bacterium]|nr:hypothetical protein [Chloroflexota bacterium]